MVAAAVVEVQVRVDDDVDAGEVEGVLAQRDEPGVDVGNLRAQLRKAWRLDQHADVGMVDDVNIQWPALAVIDEQLGHEQRRDCGRRGHSPIRTGARGALDVSLCGNKSGTTGRTSEALGDDAFRAAVERRVRVTLQPV